MDGGEDATEACRVAYPAGPAAETVLIRTTSPLNKGLRSTSHSRLKLEARQYGGITLQLHPGKISVWHKNMIG